MDLRAFGIQGEGLADPAFGFPPAIVAVRRPQIEVLELNIRQAGEEDGVRARDLEAAVQVLQGSLEPRSSPLQDFLPGLERRTRTRGRSELGVARAAPSLRGQLQLEASTIEPDTFS